MTAEVEVLSFGCRLNAAEGTAMRELAAGQVERPTIIVNTCAVTAAAERDARRAIRRLGRERPDAEIVVTGCAAQRAPETFAAMPEVARVLGNAEKLVATNWRARARVLVGDIMRDATPPALPIDAAPTGTRAVVEAQHGCDHRCTFCIIPFTRGPARSQPFAALVARVARLADAGVGEVVLSGVDLASYGADLGASGGLGALVRALLRAVPGLPRLRLSSIDPAGVDAALLDAFACEPRLMPHAHLSLQSGDDLILKRMKRRHSRAGALAAIASLRGARSDLAVGADLIAGFPTEDEDAAARTRALVDVGGLAFVHAFAFDPRPGTAAARMPQLPAATIAARAAALRATAHAALAAHLARQVGRRVDVLVERDGQSGHAADFSRVRLATPAPPGRIVAADVVAASADLLTARAA